MKVSVFSAAEKTDTFTQSVQRTTAQSQRVVSDAAEKETADAQVPGRPDIEDDVNADSVTTAPDDELIKETMMDEGVLHNNLEVTHPSHSKAATTNTPAIISQYDDTPAGNTRASRRHCSAHHR